MRAEPVVARTTHGNAYPSMVRAYITGLFSGTGQALAAKHFFRTTPPHPDSPLPALKNTTLVTLEDLGGMASLHAQHFAEGALFDQCTTYGGTP
jgi:sulfate/thiosulfate transport system substrate-binding protein